MRQLQHQARFEFTRARLEVFYDFDYNASFGEFILSRVHVEARDQLEGLLRAQAGRSVWVAR